jgi:putative ABC transport system permease protein
MLLIRDALRRLRREPRLPATMIAVLSIALGAASAVFTITNAVVLKPVPYPHADRLVAASIGARVWSTRMLAATVEANMVFDAIAGVHERAVTLAGDGTPDVVRLEAVSADYFDLVGMPPSVGRAWTRDDDAREPAAGVVLVSDGLWRRRYAADPQLVGRPIVVDGTMVTVSGVMPRGFRGVIGRADLWVPLRLANTLGVRTPAPERLWSRWFEVIARAKPAVGLEQARRQFESDARRAVASIPGSQSALGSNWRATLVPLEAARRDPRVAQASQVLLAGIAFVLLLAAINLAGLERVRADGRARELAIRAAIGAPRRHAVGVVVAEVSIVVLSGLAGGLALRSWLIEALLAVRPEAVTFGLRSADVLDAAALRLDPPSAVAIAGAAAACGAIITALSAWRAGRPALDALSRGSTASASVMSLRRLRAGTAIVAVELALGVLVAAGAGLMARAAANLWAQDRAIDPDGVMTLRLLPTDSRYDATSLPALFAELERTIGALPGVDAVSLSNCAPGTGRCRQTNVQTVDGRALDPARRPTVGVHYVTTDHFAVLRTPLVRGRTFDRRDAAGATRTVVVNEAAARQLWPGETPIGRRLSLFFASGADTEDREVVGVVDDIRFDAIEDAPRPDVFVPAAQMAWTSAVLFVRGRGGQLPAASAVQTAIGTVDPNLAVSDVKPLTARLGGGFAVERFLGFTLAAFSIAALALAGIGVYGLLSHAVARGRRECAIRLAIGAGPGRIFWFVASRACVMVTAGIGAGTLAAIPGTRILASFLYGVRPGDPMTLAGAAATLATVAAIAAAIPAHRAARLSPAELLRE